MKYARVYLFLEARWAVENIRRRRLKVCRFFDLNDPFELLAGEQGNRALRKRMKSVAATLNEQYGLLCFTECWRDPLMWSHYGDRHKGICLGFDVDVSSLEPINYSPQRLAVSGLAPTSLSERWTRMLLTTKFARWRYEKERRVVSPLLDLAKEGELFFRSFDQGLKLAVVFAGPKCCVKWKASIKSAVKALPIKPKLIKARLSFKEFKVVTQKLDNSVTQGFESDTTWQECACPSPKAHDSPDSRT